MGDLIQFYSTNKSKLFDLGIEVLYVFALLFFARQLYGIEFTFDTFLDGAKSISISFFKDIIGLSLSYLFIAFIVQLTIILLTVGIEELIMYVGFKIRKRKYVLKESKDKYTYTFDKQLQKLSRNIYTDFLYRLFVNLDEKYFKKNLDYFLLKKGSKQSGRIFVILIAYLIIDFGFKNAIGVIDYIVFPALAFSIAFYIWFSRLEEIIAKPDFLAQLQKEKSLRNIKQIIKKNANCTQRTSKNNKSAIRKNSFFVVDNQNSVIGWFIIIDQDVLNTNFNTSTLKKNRDKTTPKVLLDIFDLIPEISLPAHQYKTIKSINEFNIEKEVNALKLHANA